MVVFECKCLCVRGGLTLGVIHDDDDGGLFKHVLLFLFFVFHSPEEKRRKGFSSMHIFVHHRFAFSLRLLIVSPRFCDQGDDNSTLTLLKLISEMEKQATPTCCCYWYCFCYCCCCSGTPLSLVESCGRSTRLGSIRERTDKNSQAKQRIISN